MRNISESKGSFCRPVRWRSHKARCVKTLKWFHWGVFLLGNSRSQLTNLPKIRPWFPLEIHTGSCLSQWMSYSMVNTYSLEIWEPDHLVAKDNWWRMHIISFTFQKASLGTPVCLVQSYDCIYLCFFFHQEKDGERPFQLFLSESNLTTCGSRKILYVRLPFRTLSVWLFISFAVPMILVVH